MSEAWLAQGRWPHSNAAAGPEVPPDAIADVVVSAGSVITATFRRPADLLGTKLVLEPRAGEEEETVHWSCSSPDIAATRPPEGCR